MWRNVVWNRTAEALVKAFIFQTTTPRRLVCNNHENKYFICILPRQQKELVVFPYRKTKQVNLWRHSLTKLQRKLFPRCILVILRMQTIGFLFERNGFNSFNHRWECLYYIFINSWSVIDTVPSLFLSTKRSNRGRL